MRNSRWIRIHEENQEFEAKENVMDVIKGNSNNRAEVIYTANTRTIEKAVYWLLRYIGYSKATQLFEFTHEEIEKAATTSQRGDEHMQVAGEGWSCTIEKMSKGKFKVSLNWLSEIEPVELPVKKSKKETEPVVETKQVETTEEVKTATKKKNKKRTKKAA